MSRTSVYVASVIGFDPNKDPAKKLLLLIAIDDDAKITPELLHKQWQNFVTAVFPVDDTDHDHVAAENIAVHFKADNISSANKQLNDCLSALIRDHDANLSPTELASKYGRKGTGEHPLFNQETWRDEAFTGYWHWVRDKMKGTMIPAAEVKSVIFETAVKGFDNDSDETEDLLLWVAVDVDSAGVPVIAPERLLKEMPSLQSCVIRPDLEVGRDDIHADSIDVHFRSYNLETAHTHLSALATGLMIKRREEVAAKQANTSNTAPMSDPPAQKTVAELRAAGYCVVMFNPSELEGAGPTRVADRLAELGNDVIDDLKPKEQDTSPSP